MRNATASLLIVAIAASFAFAQQMAPRETATAMVGGKKISVEYGRPALKGRSVEELTAKLPPHKIWRAGSEQITTLTTETALKIGSKTVPAGKYSLYVHCGENGRFSLIVNSSLGQPLGKIWGQAPDQLKDEPWPHFNYPAEIADKEVARVEMRKMEAKNPSDLFTIKLQERGKGAALIMTWGSSSWGVPLTGA